MPIFRYFLFAGAALMGFIALSDYFSIKQEQPRFPAFTMPVTQHSVVTAETVPPPVRSETRTVTAAPAPVVATAAAQPALAPSVQVVDVVGSDTKAAPKPVAPKPVAHVTAPVASTVEASARQTAQETGAAERAAAAPPAPKTASIAPKKKKSYAAATRVYRDVPEGRFEEQMFQPQWGSYAYARPLYR